MSYHAISGIGGVTDDFEIQIKEKLAELEVQLKQKIDEYADYSVEALIRVSKSRFKAEIPEIVDDAVAAATPKVTALANELAPQILSDMKPQITEMVKDMMQVALADASLQAMIDTSKKEMMLGLALTAAFTIAGVVGIQYLMKS